MCLVWYITLLSLPQQCIKIFLLFIWAADSSQHCFRSQTWHLSFADVDEMWLETISGATEPPWLPDYSRQTDTIGLARELKSAALQSGPARLISSKLLIEWLNYPALVGDFGRVFLCVDIVLKLIFCWWEARCCCKLRFHKPPMKLLIRRNGIWAIVWYNYNEWATMKDAISWWGNWARSNCAQPDKTSSTQ